MKKNGLIIGQALLFASVMIFFGLIVVNEKLPDLLLNKAEKEINSYYNKNFKDLNLKKGKIKYNKKTKSYSITYYNKDYDTLNFSINYKRNKITDNYKKNFLEGKEVIKDVEKKVNSKYNDIFINTNYKNIKVVFMNLDNYTDEERLNILDNNFCDKGYYKVSFYVNVDSLDSIYLINLINSFKNLEKDNSLLPNSYSITFDNNGIIKLIELGKGESYNG